MPRACVLKKKNISQKAGALPNQKARHLTNTTPNFVTLQVIASFLLVLHLISSPFRKCAPRSIQLPEKGGKEVAAERGWCCPILSYRPSLLLTLLQKHESHSCLFAEYEQASCYNFKNRSASPLDNQGVSGQNGCPKLWQCPNLACLKPH